VHLLENVKLVYQGAQCNDKDSLLLYAGDLIYLNNGVSVTVIAKKKENKISVKRLDKTVASVSKENEKHTILIIGDSHIRECACKVKDYLNKNYSVTGMVKPGSYIFTLANTAVESVQTLTKNGVLVLSGCKRDVWTNTAKEELRYIQNFVR